MIRSFHDQSKYIQHAFFFFFQATQALTILSFFSFLLLIVPSHLQPQADSFGDCRLRKRGLHHRHQFACQRTPLRSNQVALLLDSRHDGKVKGEVGGDDAADSLLPELLLTFQVWGDERRLSSQEVTPPSDMFERLRWSVTHCNSYPHPSRWGLFLAPRHRSDCDVLSRLSRSRSSAPQAPGHPDPEQQSGGSPRSPVCHTTHMQLFIYHYIPMLIIY